MVMRSFLVQKNGWIQSSLVVQLFATAIILTITLSYNFNHYAKLVLLRFLIVTVVGRSFHPIYLSNDEKLIFIVSFQIRDKTVLFREELKKSTGNATYSGHR